jgi:hypothetical protein
VSDGTYAAGPRLVRGALVSGSQVIPFQYNPETLTRTVVARAPAGGGTGSTAEALRLNGPPTETLQVEIQLDATDQLAAGDATAASMGVGPMLAAIELILYPPSALAIANEALALAGIIEVVPPVAPLCLFVWGPQRVLPVRLNQLSITEEAFDANLNPIQAKVALSLQVLTYQDLGFASIGGSIFLGQQMAKEAMAALATSSTGVLSFKVPGI